MAPVVLESIPTRNNKYDDGGRLAGGGGRTIGQATGALQASRTQTCQSGRILEA